MPPPSSYLRYLPPILWDRNLAGPAGGVAPGGSGPPDLPLGQLLCIFEELLTGLDEAGPALAGLPSVTATTGGSPRRASIASVIDHLHETFDPWHARVDLLPWLASWVALEFPTHPIAEGDRAQLWDEYQRRKVTSEMAQIYRLRGLKDGLNRFLDLYTVGDPVSRPRIAVDDGSRLLVLDPTRQPAGRLAVVSAHNPTVYRVAGQAPGQTELVQAQERPVHPSCVALAPDGSVLLGELGTIKDWQAFTPAFPGSTAKTQITSGVWRYQSLAAAALGMPERIATTPPVGTPAGSQFQIEQPIAIVATPGPNPSIFILDRLLNPAGASGVLYRVDPPTWTDVKLRVPVDGTVWPVGMALDQQGQNLLILDRGGSIALSDGPSPRVIRVPLTGSPPVPHAPFVNIPLPTATEPLSLAVVGHDLGEQVKAGDLLIGDGGTQNDASPGTLLRARLVGNAWEVVPLIAPVEGNPLVAPLALAEAADGSIYVADLGLKPYQFKIVADDLEVAGKEFLAHRREPAAIYQVRADQGVVVTRASELGQLVHPAGLFVDGPALYVADQGASASKEQMGSFAREWRAEPHQFGVVVHFPPEPVPPAPNPNLDARRQVLRTISSIADREKPAHADWSYAFSYLEN